MKIPNTIRERFSRPSRRKILVRSDREIALAAGGVSFFAQTMRFFSWTLKV
jgi:hypothetical protein